MYKGWLFRQENSNIKKIKSIANSKIISKQKYND